MRVPRMYVSPEERKAFFIIVLPAMVAVGVLVALYSTNLI